MVGSRRRSFRRKKRPEVDDLDDIDIFHHTGSLKEPDNGSSAQDKPEKKGFMKKLKGVFSKSRHKSKRGSTDDTSVGYGCSPVGTLVENQGFPGFPSEPCASCAEDISYIRCSFDRNRGVRQTAPDRIRTHISEPIMPRPLTAAVIHAAADRPQPPTHSPGRRRGVRTRDPTPPRPQTTAPPPPPFRPFVSLPPAQRRRRRARRPSDVANGNHIEENPVTYNNAHLHSNCGNQNLPIGLRPCSSANELRGISPEITATNTRPSVVHYHLTLHNCDGVEINCVNSDPKCPPQVQPRVTCDANNQKVKRLSWVELPPCAESGQTDGVTDASLVQQTGEEPAAVDGEFYLSEEGQRLLGHQDHVIIASTDVLDTNSGIVDNAGSMDTLRLLRMSPYDGLPAETQDVGSMDTIRLLSVPPSASLADNNGDISLTERHLELSKSLADWQIEQLDMDEASTMQKTPIGDKGTKPEKSQREPANTENSETMAPSNTVTKESDSSQSSSTTCDQSIQVDGTGICRCSNAKEPLDNRISKTVPVQRVTPSIRKIEIHNPAAAARASANQAASATPQPSQSHTSPPPTPPATTVTSPVTTASSSQNSLSSAPQLASLHTQSAAALDTLLRMRLERVLGSVRAENTPFMSSGRPGSSRNLRNARNDRRAAAYRVNVDNHRSWSNNNRDMSVNEKLARVRESLIRMPGVLILGVRRGKIIVTLSPERRDTRDISRFMHENHIHYGEYECGVLARRFQASRQRNWHSHASCLAT